MVNSIGTNMMFNFRGKTVLITGHTGFKGSWLTAWLVKLGANVVGIALAPPTDPSHFDSAKLSTVMNDLRIDIRNQKDVENTILKTKPDFVFHLAAQSLVRQSYENPIGQEHSMQIVGHPLGKKIVATPVGNPIGKDIVRKLWQIP